MNPDVLRHHDFWSMADRADDSPGGDAAKVLADWLDEHDSPLRAHLLRFGNPEHIIHDVMDVWGAHTGDRPGVLLHDEGRHPRFLRGRWNPDTLDEHTVPRATYHTGPETYELFDGESTIDPDAPSRHVVRYTLLLPGGKHLRVIAPVSTGHIAEISRAFEKQNNPDDGEVRQTPWNDWRAALDLDTHPTLAHHYTEEPTKLARVILQPGVPHRPTHTGEAVFRHELHDEAGTPVGVLHVSPRNDGRTVHVHWAGRSENTTGEEGNTLGAEAIGGIRTGLAEHYPDAEFVSGHRGGGTAGQTGFRGPGERELVVKPLRRPLRLARPDDHTYNALVHGILQHKKDYANRPEKKDTDRPDPTPHLAFTDWLRENGVPGAQVVEAYARADHPSVNVNDRRISMIGRPGTYGPIVSLGSSAKYLTDGAHEPDGTVIPGVDSIPGFEKHVGEAPLAQISWGVNGRGAMVATLHHNPGGDRLYHVAHVRTPDELRAVMEDFPEESRKRLVDLSLLDPATIRRALRGKGSRKFTLARMQAAANGTIVNNQYQRGGQFLAKARKRIRDVVAGLVKLARPTDPDYHALLQGVADGRKAFSDRPDPKPADRPDTSPGLVFADWLEEHGIPGAHVVRMQSANGRTYQENNRARPGEIGRNVGVTDAVTLEDEPRVARRLLNNSLMYPIGPNGIVYPSTTEFLVAGDSPAVATIAHGKGRGGLRLNVTHATGDRAVRHSAHIKTLEDLILATSDFPVEARKKLLQPLIDNGTLRKVLRGRGKSAFKLAADTSAKGLFGRSPHEEETERPLTLGELKGIEDTHKLSDKQRLSPHVTQTVVGDEHPYSANTEDIRWFIHNVSRAALPTETLRKTLARRDLPMGAKLTHLVANMKADYEASHKGADATGGSWYKGQIDEMEKHLHGLAGGKPHPLWGDMDPETGELKGKHDPAENHPGVVIFKALLAATSGSQNPNDNMLSAARAWAAGRRRGHPIVDMPDYNTDALEKWIAKAKRLHGIKPSETDREAALRTPGTTDFQRAKWWNKWVKPYAAELDAKMEGAPPGYAAAEARVNPNHSIVWEMGGNGEKEKKGGVDVRGYTTPGSLPLVNPDGTLRTKGWGTRGEQAASGIASLKVLFEAARRHDPEGTEASHFRWVARWLLSDHDAKEFERVAKIADHMRGQLPSLGAASFAHGKHAAQGWFKKGESVPGMFILGPKFGAFGMNLNSNHPAVEQKYRRFLTADLWFTRNWARYLGQMYRGRKRKSFETPTSRDRRQMAVVIHKLCKDLGVHPADLQADLWYHEQTLYRMLGANPNRTGSGSYGQAASKYLDKKSPNVLRDKQGKAIQLARPISVIQPGETAHAALRRLLGSRDEITHGRTAKIVRDVGGYAGDISVLLHGHTVVRAHPDGAVTLDHHGFMTPTTRRFMEGFSGFPVSFAGGRFTVSGQPYENGTRLGGMPVHQWTTIPHTDPELRQFFDNARPSQLIDHTVAGALGDWLEEHNDWRHRLLRHTAIARPIAGGSEWTRADGLTGRLALFPVPTHWTPILHEPGGAESTVWNRINPALRFVATKHPTHRGINTVTSLLTPEEYEALRADAATAGVHFPKVTS